jgi:hypothetical protein
MLKTCLSIFTISFLFACVNAHETRTFHDEGISFSYPGNWHVANKMLSEYPKTIMLTNQDLSIIDVYIYNDSSRFDFGNMVAQYIMLDSDTSSISKHIGHSLSKGPDSLTVLTDHFKSFFGNNSHECSTKFTYKKSGNYNCVVILHEAEDTLISVQNTYRQILQSVSVKPE